MNIPHPLRRLASVVILAAWIVACRGRGSGAQPPRVVVPEIHAVATPTAPAVPGENPDGACAPPPPPVIAPRWRLLGYHPGPVIRDVAGLGPRRRALVAVTRSRVCVRGDDATGWTVAIPKALDNPTLHSLQEPGPLVVIAQGTSDDPSSPVVYLSRGDDPTWVSASLPLAAGPRARVTTDGEGRLYVTSDTRLWMSTDGQSWVGPRTLPGDTADGFGACGGTLVVRAVLHGDGFWHHSVDHGESWRPFRLGAIGLEASSALVRCLGWHGGVEVGRAPLPNHWTFDQGRTWLPARYDAAAHTVARTATEGVEPPHCATGPSGDLVCMDQGRLVLPDAREGGYEIHAPSVCGHVRMVDDGRVLAFGPGGGLLESTDRGGLWRAVETREDPQSVRDSGVGRGGFVGADAAWRIDGGVWWTHDAGAHWRLVADFSARTRDRGVFVDERRGVFARRDGWVVSTADGGRTWAFVMRGEVERVAGAGPWVMVTTSDRVWVSSNGGETWRSSRTIPANRPLDPSLEVTGTQRRFSPAPGLRVAQEGDRILVRRGETDVEILRGLGPGYELLAAHATGGTVDRVLLSGGGVLARASVGATAAR